VVAAGRPGLPFRKVQKSPKLFLCRAMQDAELVTKSEDINLKFGTVAEAGTAANNAEKTTAGENRCKRRNTLLYQLDPSLRERHEVFPKPRSRALALDREAAFDGFRVPRQLWLIGAAALGHALR
jgi:hypothetical protein